MTGKSLQLSKYGTAATADVQTSPTDTTAGALMAVGAFGIGTGDSLGSTSGLDLNSVTQSREFSGSNLTNAPNTGYFYIKVQVHSPSYVKQTATSITTNNVIIFERVNNNNNWTSWQRLYHTGNILGTVGQGTAGGDPVTGTVTGAIIERGSDSFGEYVKFADGSARHERMCNLDMGNNSYQSFATSFSFSNSYFAVSLMFDSDTADTWTRAKAVTVHQHSTSGFRLLFNTSGTTLNSADHITTVRAVSHGFWY